MQGSRRSNQTPAAALPFGRRRGHTEKDNALKIPLREQENLKELFRLLEQNGMTVEKKQVLQMVDYIDDMETKMDMVMKDLKEMREQISGIKNQGIRAKAEQIVAKVSERVEEAGKQLGLLKKTFLEKAGQAVRAGKEKGRKALAGMVSTLHLPGMTVRVQHLLQRAIVSADQGIGKLGDMAEEMHEAKRHLGNAGRALTGKKAEKTAGRDPERGLVFEIQRLMFQSMAILQNMEQKTGNFLERMERLTVREDKPRTSVRETIRELKYDQTAAPELPQKQKTEPVRG